MNDQTVQVYNDPFVDGMSLIDQQNRVSNIDVNDLRAKNGIVHVIDKVLLPMAKTTTTSPTASPTTTTTSTTTEEPVTTAERTIGEIIANDPDLSIFEAGLIA